MYCVRCGVRLEDGAEACPLCGTPVLLREAAPEAASLRYPDRYPEASYRSRRLAVLLLTLMLAAASLSCLISCLRIHGEASWSGYVLLGSALFWVWVALPLLFRRWRPMIFLPVDFACSAGFLLYVCLKTGGSWFLSFAFPVTALTALVTLATVALFRYIRQGRLLLFGVLLVLFGSSLMLVELFMHITFRTQMFVWSLYCVCGFGALGLFLVIASLIPSLRDALRRNFFL